MFGKPKFITKEELKQYDGKNTDLPLYLAIKGKVLILNLINFNNAYQIFDVTAGSKHYGPEGGYGYFSGKDASRAFVSGCFHDDCPDPSNLEGMRYEQLQITIVMYSADDMKGIDEWLVFYENHKEYKFVGYVTESKAGQEALKAQAEKGEL